MTGGSSRSRACQPRPPTGPAVLRRAGAILAEAGERGHAVEEFFARLKEHKLVQWLLGYAAVAVALIPVLDIVAAQFGWPESLRRGITLVLIMGFFVVLVLAWYHGERGAQKMPRSEKLILAGLIVVSGVLLWRLAPPAQQAMAVDSSAANTVDAKAIAAKPPAKNSIAVMPFADLSAAQDQALFSQGMAEEILNALTRVKGLRVLGRSSSFQFQGKDIPPQTVGQQLGVAHVLTGSVRKQGNELRITVELVRTSDGVQQWSNQYDGNLADVFKLQDACARDVASELDITLSDAGARRLVDKVTDNSQAYAKFIEAQELVTKRVGDSLPRAIALLDEATGLDPHFARAWSTLAVAYAVLPQYSNADWQTSWLASDQAAQRALALNPNDAAAYAALSYNQFSQRHYSSMVEPMQRALELAPENSAVSYWAANELAAMGRTRDAETRLDAALANDPANPLMLFYKSMLRWREGDQAGALDFIHRSGTADSPFGELILGYYDAAHGDKEGAKRNFASSTARMGSKIPEQELVVIYLGTFGTVSQKQMALKIVGAHTDDEWAPTLLLQLGAAGRSFDLYEHGHSGLSDAYLNWLWQPEPWSRKARQDVAFQGFAKRLGMVDYWKRNGWPDLCKPAPSAGENAFTCQ
jgi:TolB-like protein/Tfp pilus assembly protein PilF